MNKEYDYTKLRLIRRDKSMSLPQLAKKSGVSKGAISKLENNKLLNPGIITLEMLSRSLDMDIIALIEQLQTIEGRNEDEQDRDIRN